MLNKLEAIIDDARIFVVLVAHIYSYIRSMSSRGEGDNTMIACDPDKRSQFAHHDALDTPDQIMAI